MKSLSRPRILMLLENFPYPQDERVRREAQTLIAAGCQVAVICPASRGQPLRETIDEVVIYRYHTAPAARGCLGYLLEYAYAMLITLLLACSILIREGFDVVHAHHPPDTFGLIAAFFKLFGKRYVLDHHDLAPELYYARFGSQGNSLVYQLLVWLEQLSCRLADKVIATNESYKQMEMQRCGVPEQRISVVRNGPDLNKLKTSNPDPILRKNAETLIGYVGVMGIQDGVDYLIRALNHLKSDLGRKDFSCVLVGNGDALPDLKCLVKKLELSDHVHFTGWVESQSDVANYLAVSDICIAPEPSNPYNDRSTAQKVMEYMTMGKPIVCFDLPEHRYSAKDAALYARPNDEHDLAQKIAHLMDNAELRKEMGAKGKARLMNELAWHHQAGALVEAYEDVIR